MPKEGQPIDDWDEMVNIFNVKKFCNTVEETGARWAAVSKAGNPDAVIAMNSGADKMVYVFKEQDYLAGDIGDLSLLPSASTIDGKQWHALLWLDCFWAHMGKPGPIDPPRFSDEELAAYINACHKEGGGVTLNSFIRTKSAANLVKDGQEALE